MADENGSETTAVSTDPVQRLSELRDTAKTDPLGAAAEMWSWLRQLRDWDLRDYDRATKELEALFTAGRPPAEIEGQMKVILVMTTTLPVVDKTVTAVSDICIPWVDKRFKADDGPLRISSLASTPLRVLWPLFSLTETGNKLTFDFKTHVEQSRDRDAEEQKVLVIDYKALETNPRLLIKNIRDEIVELVPGVYLGKILFRTRGRYARIGFSALRKAD